MKKTSCKCDACQGACRTKPGWFMPGEAEKAAKLVGIPFKRFFSEYLGVDWWEGNDTFVLAPATTSMMAGEEYDYNPRGTCVFFDRETGQCGIHDAKPYECRLYMHSDGEKQIQPRKKRIVAKWQTKKNQQQIVKLLRRKPRKSKGSFSDLLFGSWLPF